MQGAEMQRGLVFGALLGRKLLVANENFSCAIYVSHSFIEQRQFPFGESEFRSRAVCFMEIRERTVIFALGKGAVHRGVEPANLYTILTR